MNFKNKFQSTVRSRIFLSHTTHITSSYALKDPVLKNAWASLKKTYNSTKRSKSTTVERSYYSIINAIFTQRRLAFCLRRSDIERLVSNDLNLKDRSFDHNQLKDILVALTAGETRILECVLKGSGRQASVYKVVDKEIVQLLTVNQEFQVTECIDYVRQIEIKQFKTDHKTDLEEKRVRKELEESNKRTETETETELEQYLKLESGKKKIDKEMLLQRFDKAVLLSPSSVSLIHTFLPDNATDLIDSLEGWE